MSTLASMSLTARDELPCSLGARSAGDMTPPGNVQHQRARTTGETVQPVESPVLRLRLDPVLSRRGALDGAWWPRSDDAGEELPALVAELDRRLGTAVHRVGLHPDTWTHIPHRILAAGRTIRVGWFHSIDRQLVSLHTARAQYDLKLLVIPPDTPADVAAAAMTLAVRGRQSELPADILATSRAGVAGSATAVAVGVWEDEGGRLVARADRAPV
jgi:hypothetical protein